MQFQEFWSKSSKRDTIPDAIKDRIAAITNQTVNDWLDVSKGLPLTLQLIKLGFAIINALELAYLEWQKTRSDGGNLPAKISWVSHSGFGLDLHESKITLLAVPSDILDMVISTGEAPYQITIEKLNDGD